MQHNNKGALRNPSRILQKETEIQGEKKEKEKEKYNP